jgi:hypothetical protein
MSVTALRFFAILILVLGLVQAVTVILWYVRSSLLPPRRLFHIVSVGVGISFAYVHLIEDVFGYIRAGSPLSWASPRCIIAGLFIGVGVHFLYLDRRARVAGKK